MANLPVPVMRTFTVGEIETAAFFNSNVRDTASFLLMLPIATVYQTATQTLTTSGTFYPVAYDSTAVDSYGGHSNVTNNSRYIAQVTGWYMVTGATVFAASASGTYRKCQIYKNGSAIAYSAAQIPMVNSGTFATGVAVAPTIVFLNVGDYVEIYAGCDVAGLGITPNTQNESYMTVFWVHN